MIQFRATSATAVPPKRYDESAFVLYADLGLGESMTIFPNSNVVVPCGTQVRMDPDVALFAELFGNKLSQGACLMSPLFRDNQDILLMIANVGSNKITIRHGDHMAYAYPLTVPAVTSKFIPYGG